MTVDLHAHLGASTPASVLFDIAMEQGIKIGTKDYFVFLESMKTPNHMVHKAYLNKFSLTQRIQSSLMAIEKSTYHSVAHAYKINGLDLIELRFNPMLRSNDGVIDLDAIIEYASIGVKKAMLAYPGIKAGIIIETDRTFTPAMAEILAKKAVAHKGNVVVGFDMSGFTPKGFSLKKFESAFKIAKAGNLGITVHAGELSGKGKEVEEAILYLYADRIGHGIQIVKNAKIMKLAYDNKIHFEVCPSSNVTTGCVKNMEEMSLILGYLHTSDVSWNLNTDGSEFLNTTIRQEYQFISAANNNFGDKIIEKSQLMARKASFIK